MVKTSLPMSRQLCMVFVLLVTQCSNCMWAQTVVEIRFDGLPESIAEEIITKELRLPTNSAYDKELLDDDRVTAGLIDYGYLDASTKSKVNYIPGGVRVTYFIKPRNRYTIGSVIVSNVDDNDIQTTLSELQITENSFCEFQHYEKLAKAFAEKMHVHYLFVKVEAQPNKDRKTAQIMLSK